MPRDPQPDPLDGALALFNAARWFEAHEAFEDLWRAAKNPRGELWKGLAQICAGLVKHERGEPRSAATLIERGLGRVSDAADGGWSPLDLPPLVDGLRAARAALLAGEEPVVPRLRRRHPV
jgi:uncharacterized protein